MGRVRRAIGDSCKRGHVLTEESASLQKDGYLKCLECQRADNKGRRAGLREIRSAVAAREARAEAFMQTIRKARDEFCISK